MKIICDAYMLVDCSLHGLVQLVGLMGNPHEVSSLSLGTTLYMVFMGKVVYLGFTQQGWVYEVALI